MSRDQGSGSGEDMRALVRAGAGAAAAEVKRFLLVQVESNLVSRESITNL